MHILKTKALSYIDGVGDNTDEPLQTLLFVLYVIAKFHFSEISRKELWLMSLSSTQDLFLLQKIRRALIFVPVQYLLCKTFEESSRNGIVKNW